MVFDEMTLIIIAGGKSSRMGRDKRFIELNGESLLEIALKKVAAFNFAEIIISVEAELPELKMLAARYKAKLVIDERKGRGPLEGLRSALGAMNTERAMVISVDTPFLRLEKLAALCDYEDFDVVIAESHGRVQPLAGIYRRTFKNVAEKCLQAGDNKIMQALAKVNLKKVPMEITADFFNVNTPAAWRMARGRAANVNRTRKILSVTAPASGTGKTTFIEKLLRNLAEENINVGVIKSDCHGFNLDHEGKDSDRFQKAGAISVAVAAPEGYFLVQKKKNPKENLLGLAEKMEDVAAVIIESRTHLFSPCISLWRGKGEPVISDEVAVVFAKDLSVDENEIFCFDLDDEERALATAKFLLGF